MSKEISMRSHIVPAGSERPDPERLRTLTEYRVPGDSKTLPSLNGFFAYIAKRVTQNSSRCY